MNQSQHQLLIRECYQKAKQKWLEDNPGLSEFSFDLISERERNYYVFEQLERAGLKQTTIFEGKPVFE